MRSRIRFQASNTLFLFYLIVLVYGLFWVIVYCLDNTQSSCRIRHVVKPSRNIFQNQSNSQRFQHQARTRNYDFNDASNKIIEELRGDFHFPETLRTTPLSVSCPKLFSGNTNETGRENVTTKVNPKLSTQFYEKLTKDCRIFKHRRNYVTSFLTQEEKDFPIAYSMVVYKDLEQVERLLRAIYRPQNYYCIHVDLKAKAAFRKTLAKITNCFENVFITKTSVDVRWGKISVLKPELICMSELWNYTSWKYFINLTGQEFPLQTNAEFVRILKFYNDSNAVHISDKRVNNSRWSHAGKPPAGIRPVKGSLHVAVNRHFVDYVLHNNTAKKLLDWCKKTRIPDETFFPTLHFNKQLDIQGSDEGEQMTYLTRFKIWNGSEMPCKGKRVRRICIFGVGDLPSLKMRPELFANKFHLDFEPLTLDCLEELIYNRTRDEYLLL